MGLANKVPSYSSLRRKFKWDVCRGNNIYQMLCVTNTGTGFNVSTGNTKGQCVLDSSSGKWFMCTATAGTGTWTVLN